MLENLNLLDAIKYLLAKYKNGLTNVVAIAMSSKFVIDWLTNHTEFSWENLFKTAGLSLVAYLTGKKIPS